MKLGFLSDAHGNFEAFDRGITILRSLQCDEIYFLGDAIGYFLGDEVVSRIVEENIPSLRGNHEEMLLLSNLHEKRDCVYRLAQTRATMSDANRGAIASWPVKRDIRVTNGRLLLVHGSPDDPTNGRIYPDTQIGSQLAGDIRAVFCGHTHWPVIFTKADVLYVNVGSVGLPRDDGRFGAVACYDTEDHVAEVLRFDITTATARSIERCGPVHDDVMAVLGRRSREVFGKAVDG